MPAPDAGAEGAVGLGVGLGLGPLGDLARSLNAILYVAAPEPRRPPVFVTPAVEELLGYTEAEWLAEPDLYWTTIAPLDRARIERECQGYLEHGRPLDLRYRRVARDGRLLWFRERFVLGPIAPGGPPLVQGVMLDASELGILEETLALVVAARTIDAALAEVASLMARHLGFAYVGFVGAAEPDRSFLRRWAEGMPEVARGAALAGPPLGPLVAHLRAGTGTAHSAPEGGEADPDGGAEAVALALPGGRRIALGFVLLLPLELDGAPFGALCALAERPRALSPLELRVAESMRVQGQVALERAALVERLERLSTERGELSRAVLRAQEDERRRLARTLHDLSGQMLTAALIRIDTADARVGELGAPAESARRELSVARSVVASALDDLRRLSHDLRPPALDQLGLRQALEEMAQQLASPGLVIDAAIDLGARLRAEDETLCFRIAQAALTNAVRHAGARRIELTLGVEGDRVRLRIQDDGRGLPAGEGAGEGVGEGGPGASPSAGPGQGAGLGLVAMRERAEEVGGRFAVRAAPGGGTVIEVDIPHATR